MVAQAYESTQIHRIVHLNRAMFVAHKWYLNLKKIFFWRLSAEDEGSIPGQGTKIPIMLHVIPTCMWGSESKESPCNAGDLGSIPGLGRFPWRREWLPTPIFLPGESHR